MPKNEQVQKTLGVLLAKNLLFELQLKDELPDGFVSMDSSTDAVEMLSSSERNKEERLIAEVSALQLSPHSNSDKVDSQEIKEEIASSSSMESEDTSTTGKEWSDFESAFELDEGDDRLWETFPKRNYLSWQKKTASVFHS